MNIIIRAAAIFSMYRITEYLINIMKLLHDY